MSVFGSIMSALGLGGEAEAQPTQNDAEASADFTTSGGATEAGDQSGTDVGDPPVSGTRTVNVAAMLRERAANTGQALNYDTSIVDLLRLLGLPSDLHTRRELAQELNYSGSTDDTASMNMWLHRQVMAELEQHGGQIPGAWKHPG